MNTISPQIISFTANPKDFPAIKKACAILCDNLAANSLQQHVQPVDIAEFNGKIYLSSLQNNGKPVLKVSLTDKNGIDSYTLIQTKSLKNCQEFLKSKKALTIFSDIIEALKSSAKKASESEAYLG